MSVYVVQHVYHREDGSECVKMIGVYESRQAAEDAVQRLAAKPGFNNFPKIVDPLHIEEANGFNIDEFRIGEDHWADGFVTMN